MSPVHSDSQIRHPSCLLDPAPGIPQMKSQFYPQSVSLRKLQPLACLGQSPLGSSDSYLSPLPSRPGLRHPHHVPPTSTRRQRPLFRWIVAAHAEEKLQHGAPLSLSDPLSPSAPCPPFSQHTGSAPTEPHLKSPHPPSTPDTPSLFYPFSLALVT